MSISFGSASKKPYVGSKEVKEAYVGSTLVYQSVLPEIVIFDGYTSNVINEIATNGNTSYPVKVTASGNKYKMEFTGRSLSQYSSLIFPTLKRKQIFIDNTTFQSNSLTIGYYNDNTKLSQTLISNNTGTFTLPENCNKIILSPNSPGSMGGCALWVCKLL